jgi:hypothetical protein
MVLHLGIADRVGWDVIESARLGLDVVPLPNALLRPPAGDGFGVARRRRLDGEAHIENGHDRCSRHGGAVLLAAGLPRPAVNPDDERQLVYRLLR